jgi:hypothetical protein
LMPSSSTSEEEEENSETPPFLCAVTEAPMGWAAGGEGGVGALVLVASWRVGSLVPCFDAGSSRWRPAGAG